MEKDNTHMHIHTHTHIYKDIGMDRKIETQSGAILKARQYYIQNNNFYQTKMQKERYKLVSGKFVI